MAQITGFKREKPPRGGFSTRPNSELLSRPSAADRSIRAGCFPAQRGSRPYCFNIALSGADEVIERALTTSVNGTKPTSRDVRSLVAIGGKADMG